MTDDPRLEEARTRTTVVAAGLVSLFGTTTAAGVLGGALMGVLTEAFGDETAVQYLHDLADELAADDTAPTVGHG